jgi:hypothetical protein
MFVLIKTILNLNKIDVCTTNPEPGAPGAADPPPEAELGQGMSEGNFF